MWIFHKKAGKPCTCFGKKGGKICIVSNEDMSSYCWTPCTNCIETEILCVKLLCEALIIIFLASKQIISENLLKERQLAL